jgi:hypothetical protein
VAEPTTAPRWRTPPELARAANEKPPERGLYLVDGCLTELDAYQKAGKTTFLLRLARALIRGEEFLGRPTLQTPVVYLNEAADAAFVQGLQGAGLLEEEHLHILSWHDVLSLTWEQRVDSAARRAREVGAHVVMVDTFAQWAEMAGDDENSSGAMLAAVRPLQALASAGPSVALARHARKSGGQVGHSGRGSSALSGAVDMIVELKRPEGQGPANRRILSYRGRFGHFPDELTIDLDGPTYRLEGAGRSARRTEVHEAIVLSLLPFAPVPGITSADLERALKASGVELGRTSLDETLSSFVEGGVIHRQGGGRKGDPFRYYRLPDSFAGTTTPREGLPESNRPNSSNGALHNPEDLDGFLAEGGPR